MALEINENGAGEDMEMRMHYQLASCLSLIQKNVHAVSVERFLHCEGNLLDEFNVIPYFRPMDLREMGVMLLWDNKRMAFVGRIDVKERKVASILGNFLGRDRPGNDLAKKALLHTNTP